MVLSGVSLLITRVGPSGHGCQKKKLIDELTLDFVYLVAGSCITSAVQCFYEQTEVKLPLISTHWSKTAFVRRLGGSIREFIQPIDALC